MRFTLGIVTLILGLTSPWAMAEDGPRSVARSMDIEVESGGWKGVNPSDIKIVLASVAAILAPSFPGHMSDRILVTYSDIGPSVLLKRATDGTKRVYLKVEDARWDQFAYQFSHELCHIFTNHEHREVAPGVPDRDHQWFEETLCEAVSLYTLERLSVLWEQAPPRPRWREYAPAFQEYAGRLLAESHRRLPQDQTLGQWLSDNEPALEGNPYLRKKNELLAGYLLPLLKASPTALEAVGYLNAVPGSKARRSLAGYLRQWRECCPERHRAFVAKVMLLLGEDGERAA